MNAHSVVEDWEATPFDGGFGGLDDLGSRGFDGAVEAADTWLFLRGGEPIAVVSDLGSSPHPGDIDAFEGASGQKHEAPDSAAVTLAAMLALDGEVRGRYFTDDTPLSAVHDTLSGGGFTGYVELSENVLSGDYYYVYVDGEVDHVGFVGSSQRLYGEEARTKAEGEVGIYAVTAVSLPDLELPDAPDDPEPGSEPDPEPASGPEPEPDIETGASSASAVGSDDEPGDTPTSSPGGTPSPTTDPTETTDEGTEERSTGGGSEAVATADPRADTGTGTKPTDSEEETENRPEPAPEATAPANEEPEATERTDSNDRDSSEGTADEGTEIAQAESEGEPAPEATTDPYPTASDDRQSSDRTAGTRASKSRSSDRSTANEPGGNESTRGRDSSDTSESGSGVGRLATRSVPSLDPERSGEANSSSGGAGRSQSTASRNQATSASRSADTADTGTKRADTDGRSPKVPEEELGKYEARIEELETELEAHESELNEYEEQIEGYEKRIDELEAELEAVRSERDELKERLEAMDDDSAAGTSYSPEAALAETSLFVRERTRGEATLEDGHDGTEDRETVISNLRIDYHTTFDSADATVDNEPFETWLRSSPLYEFAEWLVTELLFEIRSTGAQDGLQPLYDVLPAIDRVGFVEEIPTGSAGESDDPETTEFDIVARDKKGNPLVVAHFDQRRDPTHADTIGPFVTDSSDVCEANETLAAAIAVTSSYFEADAMSAAEEATSSSLLSRNKYRSYVTLSRSNGYHLCLVEARDDSFNLTVPEL